MSDGTRHWIRTVLQWLARQAPLVPEEISYCEFECRKTRCTVEEWLACKRRIAAAQQDALQRD